MKRYDLELVTELVDSAKTKAELKTLLRDLLTDSEIQAISERWQIVALLLDGQTQRAAQKEAGTSISKVTHAANYLKSDGDGFRLAYKRLKKKT